MFALNCRAKMIAFVHQWFSKVAPQSAAKISTACEPSRQTLTVSGSPSLNKLWESALNKIHTKMVTLEVISECFLGKTHGVLVGDL